MTQWYVRRGKQEQGPLTPQELKKLVAAKQLLPTDEVRTADKPEWRKAGAIKGLFDPKRSQPAVPGQPTVQAPDASTSVSPPPSEPLPFWLRPEIITVTTVCCWPLGLPLLWANPRIETRWKGIWTLITLGVFLLLNLLGSLVPKTPDDRPRTAPSAPTVATSSVEKPTTHKATPDSMTLDAAGVEDLIDHPEKYAGKVLELEADWEGRESLREGGEGFYWPFSIGGGLIRRNGSVTHAPRRTAKVRISSSDVHAEFESMNDLPNVGGNDRVRLKIHFDGDFENCRLLNLTRK